MLPFCREVWRGFLSELTNSSYDPKITGAFFIAFVCASITVSITGALGVISLAHVPFSLDDDGTVVFSLTGISMMAGLITFVMVLNKLGIFQNRS